MARHNKRPSNKPHIAESYLKPTGLIREQAPPKLDRVVFCFKYLEQGHQTFKLQELPKQFGKWLLERFSQYGQMPFNEFAPATGNSSLHSHKAEIDRIEAHGGFPLIPKDLWHERPWQIQIQNKIRAVGFLTGTIFHVVWIDKDHKFDPGKGR